MENESPIRFDAIYARQSIDKSDSISVESQIEQCTYETRGNPFRVYADRGYSGKNTDRPEFQKLLKDLHAGKIRRVICYKLDRCSRSILDFTGLMEEFRHFGVEFVSCTEKFDTSTPMGRAMLNICIVFAQLERETIQQRVTDAYRSRSRKGFYMGGRIPFGFRLGRCTIDGKCTARYEAEPEEAQLLAMVYQRYAEPDASLGDVAAALQAEGIRNPRRPDGRWIRSNLGKLLANPIYVRADPDIYRYFHEKGVSICNDPRDFCGIHGCYLYREPDGGQYLVLAPHEGLISSELWLQCRNKSNGRHQKPASRCSSFLTGKLQCAGCGHSLTISVSGNGKYRYVVCPHSHGADRCCTGIRGWKLRELEELSAEFVIRYLSTRFPRLPSQPVPEDSGKQSLDLTIAQLQCEIEKAAAKALESSGALFPYLNRHVQNLERQKKALLRRRAQQAAAIPADLLPDYEDLWNRISLPDQRRILDAVLDHITVSGSEVCFFWKL